MTGSINVHAWLRERELFYYEKANRTEDETLLAFFNKYAKFMQRLGEAVNGDARISLSQQEFLRSWWDDFRAEQQFSQLLVLQCATYLNSCRT